MIELWLADVIILSVMFGIVLLLLIAFKGHDLCHRNKYVGLIFLFISLNVFGLIWGINILSKSKQNNISPQS